MKLLLDTHALIWAVDSPSRLSTTATKALEDPGNGLLVSAASIWETSIKVAIGKLVLTSPFSIWMTQAVKTLGATLLPITLAHADCQVSLPFHHRDPFDRMLIAQAVVEGIPIVSNDSALDAYSISRLW